MKDLHIEGGNVSFGHGRIDKVPPNMNYRHCHDRYEILYVIDGQGSCIVEGVEYPIKPRTLFIFSPLVYHVANIEPGSAYTRSIIRFDLADVSKSVLDAFGSFSMSITPVYFYKADNISDSIASAIERFETAESFPEYKRGVYMKLLLSELMMLVSMLNTTFVESDNELGARVLSYINDHLFYDVSLDSIAKRFFVSKYYLCRAFKKYTGTSIHGYINQKRVVSAKLMIEAGETASRAADKVGFGDYSAFYRAYVKYIGKSPSASINESEDNPDGF